MDDSPFLPFSDMFSFQIRKTKNKLMYTVIDDWWILNIGLMHASNDDYFFVIFW